jgi:hypothetical protein
MDFQQISVKLPLVSKTIVFNEGFSLEENYLMLEIGSAAVLSMKREMFGMKDQDKEKIKGEIAEIYKNEINCLKVVNTVLKTEYAEQLERQKEENKKRVEENTQIRCDVEREKYSFRLELEKSFQNKLADEVERKRETIEKEVVSKLDTKADYSRFVIQELTEKVNELTALKRKQEQELEISRDKIKLFYERELKQNAEEREKSNAMMAQLNEKLEDINNKNMEFSSKNKGICGEKQFFDLAMNTFCDFKDFQMKDTSALAKMGDFHMIFENFTIMVDCKKYTKGVTSINREKLKRDLENNKNIKIAWMVSLDSHNNKYGKYPFMFDTADIQNGMCVCYINSLLSQPNPEETLKTVWYICEMLSNTVLNSDDKEELTSLKNYKRKTIEFIKNLSENNKYSLNCISQLEEKYRAASVLITDFLKDEMIKVRDEDFELVKKWWEENFERRVGEMTKSNLIHGIFKKQYPENRISTDGFKAIMKRIVGSEDIETQKTSNAALIIHNYCKKGMVEI